MKFNIVLLVSLLMASTSYGQVSEFLCKRVPKGSFSAAGKVAVGCAKVIPADVLDYLFEKKNEKDTLGITKFEAKQDNSRNTIAVLGTEDHAYYLKMDSSKKLINLQQGQGNGTIAPYCYTYSIQNQGGVRYCNAEAPKQSAECLKKWANDPIRNPKGQTKSCEVFLSAIEACSASDQSTQKCIGHVFARMNSDTSKPVPNPHNKPFPSSEEGIADRGQEEFCGEPDMPPCREGGAISPKRSRGSK